ncbi:MAG: four helix bundle protein [Candidatus Omnitrophica bacterium]|nr:four helix bundle protein [Candidatus Omnitrophota bacterium]
MPKFRYDFQKLDVYQKAIAFAERIFRLTEQFPHRVRYSLGDQFCRAALSICNNIAEGAQKRGAAKKQFYGYALDSARECVPMTELASRLRFLGENEDTELSDECFYICNMLYRLIQSAG